MKKLFGPCLLMHFKLTVAIIILTLWHQFYSFSQNISSGMYHAMILCEDSTVKTLGGYNVHGVVGDGSLGTVGCRCNTAPVDVAGLTGVISISAGAYHSLALKSDSTVWGWGVNGFGQLGDGTLPSTGCSCQPTPVQVIGLTGVVAISAGYYHSLALKDDGTVWSWGNNRLGELGDSTFGPGACSCRSTPIQVPGLTDVVVINAAKSQSNFAVKSDGTVWAWGQNFTGILGNNSNVNSPFPVRVIGLTNIISVVGGWYNAIALKADGTVWTWGDNSYGAIGDGTFNSGHSAYTIPVRVTSLTEVRQIASGGGFCFAQKTDGTIWSWGRAGALGFPASSPVPLPTKVDGLSGIVSIVGGGGNALATRSDGSVWVWGFNRDGELGLGDTLDRVYPTQVPGICLLSAPFEYFDHYINGMIYDDANNDCTRQISEIKFPFIAVVATPGNLYSATNDTGFYSIGVLDSITYTVAPVIPQYLSHIIRNACPGNYSVALNSSTSYDTSGYDFGFDFSPCPMLRIDVVGNRKRRCSLNYTTVSFWNNGLVPVDSVTVHVQFSQYDIPVSTSLPFTIDPSDSSMVFEIGLLDAGQGGSITIADSIACIGGIEGMTVCTKVWILPPNECFIDSSTGTNWDHSSLSIYGDCIEDSVRFVILNNGSNMSTASIYRIYIDNSLSQAVSFQLSGGDSLVVMVFAGGATIRMEADQNPGHPGNSRPRATIEACGINHIASFSTGFVSQVAGDDLDINVEEDCMEIRDSFDPNEKQSTPKGVGPDHVILKNDPIDFVIHFQNTGSDTAYKIIIVDTLSDFLDLSTLELGSSSHPYTLSLGGMDIVVLNYTFSNVNLVDSLTDESNSHGFVKYKIRSKEATPEGAVISNTADIYFDYNDPVRTNTVFLKLGSFPVLSSEPPVNDKSEEILLYPNPTYGLLSIETGGDNELSKILIFSLDGREVKKIELSGKAQNAAINISSLSSGLYFVTCISGKNTSTFKVIKL